jgi:hypothetical protein
MTYLSTVDFTYLAATCKGVANESDVTLAVALLLAKKSCMLWKRKSIIEQLVMKEASNGKNLNKQKTRSWINFW